MLGAQLLATRYFRRFCGYGAAAVTYLGESALLGDQVLASAMTGYELALGSTVSAVAQATVSQSPYRDLEIDRIADAAILVDLGIKKGLSAVVPPLSKPSRTARATGWWRVALATRPIPRGIGAPRRPAAGPDTRSDAVERGAR